MRFLDPRATARAVLTWWLGWSALGAAIIALPDSDARVVSFSRTHGPAPLDLAGVMLLLVGWTPIAIRLWHTRHAWADRPPSLTAAGLLAITGAALLVPAITLDLGRWWLAAAGLLVLAQILAVLTSSPFHPTDRPLRQRGRSAHGAAEDDNRSSWSRR